MQIMTKYIKPTTTVVKIQVESLLAALSNEDEVSNQQQLGRGFSFEPEEIETEE